MTTANTALAAAQGLDTYDLLQHIAWTDVVKPQLEEAKATFTHQLVSATLRSQVPGEDTREMLAGKLFGINYIITTFEKTLKKGQQAREALAKENLFLQ